MDYRELRETGLRHLKEKLPSLNLQRHCFAVEAIMRELARHYGEDAELWGLAGLMHDVDYEEVKEDLARHSLIGSQWLAKWGFPGEVVKAVRVHNEAHGELAQTRMEHALIFADAISGLIVSAALVVPSKKLADLKIESVLKRFKQKDFAKGVHREEILRCEKEGLSLEEFAGLSIKALQGVAPDLGL
ncbi:MAG: HDIG domain-containing protein [Candidatus Wildermuthbacteria bacterium]|nr:HDIG domain-containing protein [Candidatus Wildermuthbacteria bacterium]